MWRIWMLVVCLFVALDTNGQQMSIVGFERVKKDPTKLMQDKPDKQLATLRLITDEKGFTFLADGKNEIQAEEGEGMLTLKLPDRTKFLVAKHADYGQTSWKVPLKKGLRRKKIYKASLLAYNPDKVYKLKKQWLVMNIHPKNAIATVDSGKVAITRNGLVQFLLPVGKHGYKVESPFYEETTDTVELTDSAKLYVNVQLQPIYSYITVRAPFDDADIYIDNDKIGTKEATSGHLQPGGHRLTVLRGRYCYYDVMVNLDRAEKRVITLTPDDMKSRAWVSFQKAKPAVETKREPTEAEKKAKAAVDGALAKFKKKKSEPIGKMVQINDSVVDSVTIRVPDDETEIWIDREKVSTGSWKGTLKGGFHALSTVKDSVESSTSYVWIYDDVPLEISLGEPVMETGLLNVNSNVVNAEIWIDDKYVGLTPKVVEGLSPAREYMVSLKKAGYVTNRQKVRPVNNSMLNIKIELKKTKQFKGDED